MLPRLLRSKQQRPLTLPDSSLFGLAVLPQVSETPPEAVNPDFDDDSAMFKCSGLSGGGAEASLRDKIEASRSSASALVR